jgi:hypothetical protein
MSSQPEGGSAIGEDEAIILRLHKKLGGQRWGSGYLA